MIAQEKSQEARVFSIPLGVPFLRGLVSSLKIGSLAPWFYPADDPLRLASITIYVPTRRASRALQSIFLEDGNVTLLPRIKVLGEFDEENFDISEEIDDNSSDLFSLRPPVSPIDRLLLLSALVQKWKQKLSIYLEKKLNDPISISAGLAEAIRLAGDFARLMDEADLKDADWEQLQDLQNQDFGGWEQIILEFLSIVTQHWSKILEERGYVNRGAWSSALIRSQACLLQNKKPSGLIIAAGSTGSLPATADFLKMISLLPNGVLVLPGLDKRLDKKTWEKISKSSDESWIFTHPQYGLAKLLSKIGVRREDVKEVGFHSSMPNLEKRIAVMSEVLRPVETTDEWFLSRKAFKDEEIKDALEGISFIDACSQREEALSIALALASSVEQEGSTAALVTPDRNLARRVSVELKSLGILANDSAGFPLSRTLQGKLLIFLVRAIFEPGDPIIIASLFKNPLFSLGMEPNKVREAIRFIEHVALRGNFYTPDIFSLSSLYEKCWRMLLEQNRKSIACMRQTVETQEIIKEFLERLAKAVAPLAELRDNTKISLTAIVEKTISCIEEIAKDTQGNIVSLYIDDAGKKFRELLENLLNTKVEFEFSAKEWPDILDIFMASEVVRPTLNNARIFIWGGLEARLQNVDTIVLGGMNEGTWPRKPKGDPILSRSLRKKVKLDPPEWRISLIAHDFEMAMANPKIIITRSQRIEENPTVCSRWLQRLITFIGEEETKKIRERGDFFIQWSRSLARQTEFRSLFFKNPKDFPPVPPISLRPQFFSVSEIETLRRDPYAIYAKRILRLVPLAPLVQEYGPRERGILFHKILHYFVQSTIELNSAFALQSFLECARAFFLEEKLPEEIDTIWWAIFEKVAPQFLEEEKRRRKNVKKSYCEIQAQPIEIGSTGIFLSGRADRIDILHSGKADILDYKTTLSPDKKEAYRLLAPQLALEGVLLEKGGFKEIGPCSVEGLYFIRFRYSTKKQILEENILDNNKDSQTASGLTKQAWDNLQKLINQYKKPEQGYESHALPARKKNAKQGDYDHLARVLEWSAANCNDVE